MHIRCHERAIVHPASWQAILDARKAPFVLDGRAVCVDCLRPAERCHEAEAAAGRRGRGQLRCRPVHAAVHVSAPQSQGVGASVAIGCIHSAAHPLQMYHSEEPMAGPCTCCFLSAHAQVPRLDILMCDLTFCRNLSLQHHLQHVHTKAAA